MGKEKRSTEMRDSKEVIRDFVLGLGGIEKIGGTK